MSKNKKYVAIQQPYETMNTDYLFDDEGITSAGGVNRELFIATRDWGRYELLRNKDTFNELMSAMNDIIEWFEELEDYVEEGYAPKKYTMQCVVMPTTN